MLPDTDPVTRCGVTNPSIGAAANEPTLLQGQVHVRILGGSHPRVSKAPLWFDGLNLFIVILCFLVRLLCSIYIQLSIDLLHVGYSKAVLDGPPSSRHLEAGDRQLDPGPTEVPAAEDCRLDLGPTEVYQPATRSGLRSDPGEDQAGPPVLTTVVGKAQRAPAGTVPAVFCVKTGHTRLGLKTDPWGRPRWTPTLAISVGHSSHLEGGGAPLLLKAEPSPHSQWEREVSMGLSLLQTACPPSGQGPGAGLLPSPRH